MRERLVEQEGRRIAHQGAAQRHALLLAAGELARLAVEQGLELELGRGALDLLAALGPGDAALAQRVFDVLRHRHVRIERVGLEHHGEVALAGRPGR